MKRATFFFAGATAAGIGLVFAAAAQTPTGAHTPNAQRGAVIATQGTQAGAPGCSQCHAFNGASDGSGAFPRLTGQSAYYLARQLADFSSGVRSNAAMSPIAKTLSAEDIADVAAYYSALGAPFYPLPQPDPVSVKAGAQLATVGNESRQVQACDNCHGPGGAGEAPAIPYLAGQYSAYIAFELHMWQRGLRKSSPGEMAVVARGLDEAEIAAVAAYYQQVRGTGEVATSR